MAIEQLRNIGGVIYIDRGDGRLVPVSQGRLDDSGPATPPRADAPMSVSAPRSKSIGQRMTGLLGDIPNMLNGTGIPERLAVANEFFNPVAGVYGAMDASGQMLASNRTGYERAGSLAEMLTELAGAGLAGADLARGGVAGAAAVADSLLAGTPATRSITDTADLTAREALAYARSVGEGDLAFLRGGGVPQSLSSASKVGNVDPAVSRGQGILDMLKSGRGADVTDEMLDMGDPVANARLSQYLYRNYDLPMDEASRMERASAAGFTPVLHGTGADIAAVNPSKLGEKQDVLGRGFYTTTSPSRAEVYAPHTMVDGEKVYLEGANVMPLMVNKSGLLDLKQPTGKDLTSKVANVFDEIGFDVEVRGDGDVAFIKNPQDPKQSVMIDSYQAGQATLGRLRDAFGKKNLTNIFSEAGYSGLEGAEGGGRAVRVSYKPEDVRSAFARFDPRLSHLRNLSAAAAGTGLLGAGMQNRDRQEM